MPITLNGTTGEIPATWTTATRPASPTAGQIGYNTTTAALDVYNGTAWTTALPTTSGLATLSNLALNGSTSGTTTLSPSATASGTVTLPAGTGTVAVNGVSSNIVSGTAQASTSGTAINFTGIPSWVRRLTMSINGVKPSGSSSYWTFRIGSGSFVSTGYVCGAAGFGAASVSSANYTDGFAISSQLYNSAATVSGALTLTLLNSSTNIWAATGVFSRSDAVSMGFSSGAITLSGALDRIQITTNGGTDTFTAGNVNILYE